MRLPSGTHTLFITPSITFFTLFVTILNSEYSIIFRHFLFSTLSSRTLSHIVHTKPNSTEGDSNERKKERKKERTKERHTMTEQLYSDSTTNCIFLVTMRVISLITLLMMIMTRTIILLLITIVNLIILDIAVILRAEVSSHNSTSHTGLTSTPHDTLKSTHYKSTNTILPFIHILVFMSSFRHKVLFLYLVHILLLLFYYFIKYGILVFNYLCSSKFSLPLQIVVHTVFLFVTCIPMYVVVQYLPSYSSTPCNLSW